MNWNWIESLPLPIHTLPPSFLPCSILLHLSALLPCMYSFTLSFNHDNAENYSLNISWFLHTFTFPGVNMLWLNLTFFPLPVASLIQLFLSWDKRVNVSKVSTRHHFNYTCVASQSHDTLLPSILHYSVQTCKVNVFNQLFLESVIKPSWEEYESISMLQVFLDSL